MTKKEAAKNIRNLNKRNRLLMREFMKSNNPDDARKIIDEMKANSKKIAELNEFI